MDGIIEELRRELKRESIGRARDGEKDLGDLEQLEHFPTIEQRLLLKVIDKVEALARRPVSTCRCRCSGGNLE